MKRSLSLLAFLSIAALSYAVPARPGVFSYAQSDGTTVEIKKLGDENFHFFMTTDNAFVMRGNDNNFYFAEIGIDGKPQPSKVLAADPSKRSHKQTAFLDSIGREPIVNAYQSAHREARANGRQNGSNTVPSTPRPAQSTNPSIGVGLFPGSTFPDTGSPHVLVILVEYSNVKFTIDDPHTYFNNILNTPGYTGYGATGSARDYFSNASNGKFTPIFDVYGPVTLDNTMEYYGANNSYGNDKSPQLMAVHACNALDSTVNFADYDTDGDGSIDNVYIFYAGYGENYSGTDPNCIWPHAWYVKSGAGLYKKYDSKYLDRYACSNEYMFGYDKPEGIGTFCHEFSHVVGIADLYDTVYGSAEAATPGSYDIMDMGSYNNDGRTPSSYSIFERNAHGWADIEVISEEDAEDISLEAVTSSNKGYMIRTSATNEFFLLENRQKTSWDKYIPGHGMLIWHIDYNATTWNNNEPNNDVDHQHVDIEEANRLTNVYNNSVMAGYPYPGTTGNTTFTGTTTPGFVTWDGSAINIALTEIAEEDGVISFKLNGGRVNPPTANATDGLICSNPYELVLTPDNEADAIMYDILYGDTNEIVHGEYNGPIVLSRECVIDFWAERGGHESKHISLYFEFQVCSPTISPDEGTYYSCPTVTITSETEGAQIYYTTDGTEPNASSTLYTGPFAPTGESPLTIKAIGIRQGWTSSSVASTTYVFTEAAPEPLPNVYIKIYSKDELSDGDKIIIVNEAAAKAMSVTQNDNNRAAENIAIETVDGLKQITLNDGSNVQVLTLEAEENDFRLYDEDKDGYLYAASSIYNYLRTGLAQDNNSLASITVAASGDATIKFKGNATHNTIKYNNNKNTGNLFSCYSSGQQSVQIYKKYVPTFSDVKNLKSLANGDPFYLETMLGVTFVANEYIYTYDDNGFVLVIQKDSGLVPGDVIAGEWNGKISVVNGQRQLIPDRPLNKVGEMNVQTPSPLDITAENAEELLTADIDARPVRLNNVNLADVLPNNDSETVNVYLIPNAVEEMPLRAVHLSGATGPTVVIRNVFGTSMPSVETLDYDTIDGMANISNNMIEIYPSKLSRANETPTDIETISIDQSAVQGVRFYDLSGRLVENPSAGIYIKVCGNNVERVRIH